MANAIDGGPAFPTCVSADNEGGLNHGLPGMTLRDWFAGQAMAIVARYPGIKDESSLDLAISEWAYDLADAMLAARDPAPEDALNGRR